MLENFNDDKRKNPMTQFSDFHTGWSIILRWLRRLSINIAQMFAAEFAMVFVKVLQKAKNQFYICTRFI